MSTKSKGLSIQVITIVLLLLAVFFGWLGYQPGTLLNEYARGLGLTLLGVALVVLITNSTARQREDRLLTYLESQRQAADEAQLSRESELLKTQLIREVASGDPGLAARAIKELDGRGWLTDGTLSGSHLAGARLQHAGLAWANMNGAFLSRIVLDDADLSYSNLGNANLSDASLARANLNLASLVEADLRGTDLSLANLNEADLTSAVLDSGALSGASLVEANLTKVQAERATWNGANLERANLVESNLSYSNMERVTLSGANMGWANLSRVNLEKANLSEANLSGANLDEARLHGANLSGAFLFGARVSLKSLSTVATLAHATMPDGTKYEDWVRRQSGEEISVAPVPVASTYPMRESPLDFTPEPEEN